jgi:hypothetical protein
MQINGLKRTLYRGWNRIFININNNIDNILIGGWGKLHNKELNNLHSSQSINRMKFRSMTWIGHAARIRRKGYWWESRMEGTTRKTKM